MPRRLGWFSEGDCLLADFRAEVERRSEPADYPHAERIEQGVLVYGAGLADDIRSADLRRAVQTELARALAEGPGVVVFEGAFPDTGVVDAATDVFRSIIDGQRTEGGPAGDHFGEPGANDRIWGALDKLALADPEVFAAYYANDVLALVSQAWLGCGYQVTSQVNVVNPGGAAQVGHRDYHLGFMSAAQGLQFPLQAHVLSPALTLQGAVAHADMPVESGPTKLLPRSQAYPLGYVACHLPQFRDYFDRHCVQLPLRKGDAIFFSPALFHAAGANRTADVIRMANLLQVSSAFGRAMETVDRVAICLSLFPVLARRAEEGADPAWLDNVIAAAADGYAFPTNLDRDQPVGGMAPQTQADLLAQALAEGWTEDAFGRALEAHEARRTTLR